MAKPTALFCVVLCFFGLIPLLSVYIFFRYQICSSADCQVTIFRRFQRLSPSYFPEAGKPAHRVPIFRSSGNHRDDIYKSVFNSTHAASSAMDSGSVSIITACKGCGKIISKTLPSWLKVASVKQIIITDWGSKTPIASSIRAVVGSDTRVTVLRVSGAGDWVMSRAFNLAAAQARSPLLLKLDCDAILAPNFLEQHSLGPGEFFARDPGLPPAGTAWRTLGHSGTLLVPRAPFLAVGGYDERIVTYGWSAEDMALRLGNLAGLTQRPVAVGALSRHHHGGSSSSSSGGGDGGGDEGVLEEAQFTRLRPAAALCKERNRRRSMMLQPWGAGATRKQATVFHFGSAAAGSGSDGVAVSISRASASASALVSAKEERMVKAAAALTFLCSGAHGFSLETVRQQSRQHRIDASELVGLERPLLVLRAMHGLGNRIRAVASAAVIARATGRRLLVIWPLDGHLAAPWEALWQEREGLDVVRALDVEGNPLLRRLFRVYDYMPKGADQPHSTPLLDLSGSSMHVLVSSAYQLNHPSADLVRDAQFLRALKLAPPVARLVATYSGIEGMVGVHIRQVTQDAGVKKGDKEYSAKGWALIRTWRARSTPAVFGAEMARMLREKPDLKFFVICDDPSSLGQLRQQLGPSRVLTPTHPSCKASSADARGPRCMQYALAEVYVASRTHSFLGSTWSSFSEFITRLGGMPTRWSGVDFGKPTKPKPAPKPKPLPPPPSQPPPPPQAFKPYRSGKHRVAQVQPSECELAAEYMEFVRFGFSGH